MIFLFFIGAALVAATVLLHLAGFALILQAFLTQRGALPARPWPIAWLLVRLTWLLLLFHVAEISLWALFYLWWGCLPDAETAFYFSGTTYATIGYGDVVLPPTWRMLGPVEGLTGILMCGLSTGLFVAVISKIFSSRAEQKTT